MVGNPPYIEIKKIDDVIKPYLQHKFQYNGCKILKGRFDIFWGFIVMSIELLSNNGKLGFLTEDSLLDAVYAETLRLFIINETTVDGFKYIGKFPTANVHTVITILTKLRTQEYEFILENWIKHSKISISKSSFLTQRKKIINLNQTYDNMSKNILFKIEENTEVLHNIIFLQQGIIVQWGSGSNLQKSKKDCIFPIKKHNFEPYIEGKNVSRYKFPEKHTWLEYKPNKHHRPRIEEVFRNTKLLIRRIATEPLICLLDYGYYFTDNTLFTGTRWFDITKFNNNCRKQTNRSTKKLGKTLAELSDISKSFEYEYILAILNSKLMAFYYDNKFKTKSIDVITQCRIKKISLNKQKELGALAIKLQKLNTENYKKQSLVLKNQIQEIDDEIDQKIYDLYDLSKDEINTIDAFVQK